MKKYEKYKDSGIEWIGEIPEHWESTKLKFVGESLIGIIYSPDDVVTTGEGILVLRSSNIQNGKLAFEDCVFVNKEVQEKYLTKEGDILLCARNGSAHLVGKAAYIDRQNEGVTFGAFMSIVRSELEKYLFYFFNSQVFKAQTGLFSTSTINQLTSSTLNNMFISFPRDKQEQNAIANYLDRKTAEIDELINDKKRLLEFYEEEKTAIINQAVTKGINPNVPMKDSGIEWLGEIPANWSITKLKYVTEKIGDGIHTTPKYVENSEYKFINGNNLVNGAVRYFDNTRSVSEDEYDCHKKDIKEGTVLISINGTIGNLAFYKNEKVILGKSAAYIETTTDLFNKFLFYIFQTHYVKTQFELSYSGSTINNLSLYTLTSLGIVLPSLDEQESIIQKLESDLKEYVSGINRVLKLIDLLTEYRTTLISEVVTGKIKVIE